MPPPPPPNQGIIALICKDAVAIRTPNRTRRATRVSLRWDDSVSKLGPESANQRVLLTERGHHETLHCRRARGGLPCFVHSRFLRRRRRGARCQMIALVLEVYGAFSVLS